MGPPPLHERRQQVQLRGLLAVYRGAAPELNDVTPAAQEVRLEPEYVPRHDRTPEARTIDADQCHAAPAELGMLDQLPEPRQLRHRLYDQHARHDRTAGEVPLQDRLVGGDQLLADDVVVGDLRHAIDHQKRGAVRQQLLDALDRKRWIGHAFLPEAGLLVELGDHLVGDV